MLTRVRSLSRDTCPAHAGQCAPRPRASCDGLAHACASEPRGGAGQRLLSWSSEFLRKILGYVRVFITTTSRLVPSLLVKT